MIQTKTLKEALKDPGVIEVVEELIGVTSDKKNGLEDFRGRRVFFTGSDKFDTIKLHHSNSGIYRHISFSLRLSQEGYINSLLIFSGTTGDNKFNIRCNKAVWYSIGNRNIKFYIKQNEDGSVDIFAHTDAPSKFLSVMFVKTHDYFDSVSSGMEAVYDADLSSMTEIPINE